MEDCYFFIDPDPNVPDEEKTMSILCVKCHDEKMPDTGWFYKGSTEGYGPFEYQCCLCKKFIYREMDDGDQKETEEHGDEKDTPTS